MMNLEQKLALIEHYHETYKAWWAIYLERSAKEHACFEKYSHAADAHIWYINRAFAETDEKRAEELKALYEKFDQIKEALWSKVLYWRVRTDDALMFSDNAFQEMRNV